MCRRLLLGPHIRRSMYKNRSGDSGLTSIFQGREKNSSPQYFSRGRWYHFFPQFMISVTSQYRMLLLLVILVFVTFCIYWRSATKHPEDFPPGPRFPLPFLGDALALRGDIFEGPRQQRSKHGDIWGLWLGPYRTVYIHDFETMKV